MLQSIFVRLDMKMTFVFALAGSAGGIAALVRRCQASGDFVKE
jgi:hypothetical protein